MQVFNLNKSNVSVLFHVLIDSAYPEGNWHSFHCLVYWTINTLDKGLAKLELREPAPGLERGDRGICLHQMGCLQETMLSWPCSHYLFYF